METINRSYPESGEEKLSLSGMGKMITRILIITGLVLSCGCYQNQDKEQESVEVKPPEDLSAAQTNSLPENQPKDIDRLESLTEKQAVDMVLQRRNLFLFIKSSPSIDKGVAQELAKHVGDGISLYYLTSISKDVAKELAKFKGGDLNLDFVDSISKDVAQELVKLKGNLSLGGLTSIDKDVAQVLANFKGYLSLFGLTTVDKVVLSILKTNAMIHLSEKYND